MKFIPVLLLAMLFCNCNSSPSYNAQKNDDINLKNTKINLEKYKKNAQKIIKIYDKKTKNRFQKLLKLIGAREKKIVKGFIRNKYQDNFLTPFEVIIYKYYYGITIEEEQEFFKGIESDYNCKLSDKKLNEIRNCQVFFNKKQLGIFHKEINIPLLKFLITKEDFFRISLIGQHHSYNTIYSKEISFSRMVIDSYNVDYSKLLTKYIKEVLFKNKEGISKDISVFIALLVSSSQNLYLSNKDLEDMIENFDDRIFKNKINLSDNLLLEYNKITLLFNKKTYRKRKLDSKLNFWIHSSKMFYLVDNLSDWLYTKEIVLSLLVAIIAKFWFGFNISVQHALLSLYLLILCTILMPWIVLMLYSNEELAYYTKLLGMIISGYIICAQANEPLLNAILKNIYSKFF